MDYKTAVSESDVTEVMLLCKEPLHRGCYDDERQYLDALVNRIYGHFFVPCSMEEAKDLYLKLVIEF